MMLTGWSLATLSLVAADWAHMKNDVELLLNDTFGASRTIPKSDMDLLNEYGCWCYFESDHGKGKGQPVNRVDAQCKILHDGYECAIIDAMEAGDDECVPWEVRYNSATGYGFGNAEVNLLIEECNSRNAKDSCEARACIVEGYFVVEMLDLFVSGQRVDPDMSHGAGFDTSAECPTVSAAYSEKSCCGLYPLRFPYKTYGGEKDCCVNKTFLTAALECCPDGKTKFSC